MQLVILLIFGAHLVMEQPQSAKDKCVFLADCVARGQLTRAEALSIACSESQGFPHQQQSLGRPQMSVPSAGFMGKSKCAKPPGMRRSLVNELF
jgi:hypothetical protein